MKTAYVLILMFGIQMVAGASASSEDFTEDIISQQPPLVTRPTPQQHLQNDDAFKVSS